MPITGTEANLISGTRENEDVMEAINQSATPASAQANINAIVKLEEQALQERTTADHISDVIANFVGSIAFVAIHVIWFGVWVIINTGVIGSSWKFDPYPFALLCMLVSLEGVLLSTFVLIKQNRMSQRADYRNHLDLQVNLLAEKEVTKILQLQQLICRHLGITEAEQDAEVLELSSVTAVDNLAHELNQKLPRNV
ncbi:MAG: DUF1003 domain-containing protein [Bryobacteraceae bacterium]